MRHLLLTVSAVTTLGLASPATAQGVPTFDGSQLGQLVAQLEHMAEDLNVQMQQLATMRLELETQLSQLTNLEAQLTSLIEGSGLGELFATVERVLSGSGFTSERLSTLSDSDQPADNRIATSAGASAMLSVAAQESHEEAGHSLERLEVMVGKIGDQDGLKAAVDLNTRVTAELGIILTQIWRLEAAQGVSAGQLGVVDAATLADERKFRSMAVDP